MKKLALGALLFAGLIACGGGSDTPQLIDSGMDSGVAACNPVAQTGCAANEKCTWITDQITPTEVGHIGCAPTTSADAATGDRCIDVGDKGKCSVTTDTACVTDTECPTGETCVGAGPQMSGADNCEKGAICIAHTCETICDPQMVGTASGCDAMHACGRYSGLFDMGGTIVAGACDSLCTLLDQKLVVDGSEACGSVDPAAPNLGCYPNGSITDGTFMATGSCAPVRSDTAMPLAGNTPTLHLDRTDRVEPLVNSAGDAFKNGCAPGYIAFYFESDTSMTSLCTGLCAPTPLNSTTIAGDANREFGDSAVPAKLARGASSTAGNGLCKVGLKGSVTPENCVYIWGLFLQMDGTINPVATHGESIGLCFPFGSLKYDADGDGVDDTAYKNSKTLPAANVGNPPDFTNACDYVVTGWRNTTCLRSEAGLGFQASPIPAKRSFRIGGEDGKAEAFRH